MSIDTKKNILELTDKWIVNHLRHNKNVNENDAIIVREYANRLVNKIDNFDSLSDDSKNNLLLTWYLHNIYSYFSDDLDESFKDYGAFFGQIIKPENLNNHLSSGVYSVLHYIFQKANHENILKYVSYLKRQGLTEEEIVKKIFHPYSPKLIKNRFVDKKLNYELTSFGYFLSKSSDLDLYCSYMCSELFKSSNNNSKREVLQFIYEQNFSYLKAEIIFQYLWDNVNAWINGQNVKLDQINIECAKYLVNKDIEKWEETVISNLEREGADLPKFVEIYKVLEKQGRNIYSQKIDKIIKEYYQETFFKNGNESKTFNTWDSYSGSFGQYLLEKDENLAYLFFIDLVKSCDFLQTRLLDFIENKWKEKSLPLLVDALFKQPSLVGRKYFTETLTKIGKYDSSAFCDRLIDFALQQTNKSIIAQVAKLIAAQGYEIENKAVALLNGKTVNQRIVGALILTNIETDSAKEALFQQINSEKNDDTRDVIIETLQDRLYGDNFDKNGALGVIDHASKRGKLNKFSTSLFQEEELPKLYWNDGSILGQQEVRFLFYRIARSKGLNSDIEARSMISLFDKNKSGSFSRFVLKAFSDSGHNPKYKYLLTLSAMLGGNESVASLNTLFRKALSDKKVRLAEQAVEAMTVIGTNKALRSIEVISRKMANKKPKISKLALESLDAAASELGITQDQLSDRIIPDFDFEGPYKTFEANGEEYRAFINKDFTLSYMDEDNKIRKSLPKDTDKETKSTFSEIQKEINDVIKFQESRLSNFLSSGRKWLFDEWFNAFLNHPIMTIYAQKLVWYCEDLEGNLIHIFLVQEDTSLTDIEDNEIYPGENLLMGILHPIMIDESTKSAWKQKLYESNIKTLIPQLEREVFIPNNDELEKSITKLFADRDVPKGPDFVKSWMEKRGWYKETGDGGYLNFSKSFPAFDIKVNPWIDGVGAWFQQNEGKATVYEINFTKITNNEKVLIKDIPPIIYSEAMNDINGMLEAQ